MVTSHLSRLEDPIRSTLEEKEINDAFPEEHLFGIQVVKEEPPWFAYFANDLVICILPERFTYQENKKIFSDLKHYIWEDPYLFRVCSDQIVRRCSTSRGMEYFETSSCST